MLDEVNEGHNESDFEREVDKQQSEHLATMDRFTALLASNLKERVVLQTKLEAEKNDPKNNVPELGHF